MEKGVEKVKTKPHEVTSAIKVQFPAVEDASPVWFGFGFVFFLWC